MLYRKLAFSKFYQLYFADDQDRQAALQRGGFMHDGKLVATSLEGLEPWLPSPMEHRYLYVDLIPQGSFFKNLRSELTPSQWDIVRKKTYKKANYCCEICGQKGPRHPVEAHERFRYKEGKQILVGVQSLCPACHEATHIGLAEVKGRKEEAFNQLMNVNSWTQKETEDHIDGAFNLWRKRSKQTWELDISAVYRIFPEITPLCKENQ